jgi:hypothetical protein
LDNARAAESEQPSQQDTLSTPAPNPNIFTQPRRRAKGGPEANTLFKKRGSAPGGGVASPILTPAERSLTDPYYPTPPGGSLAAFDAWVDGLCGPRSEWTVYEVGPGRPISDSSQIRLGAGARAIIRLHAQDADYPRLMLQRSAFRCVEVVGVPDPQGRRPIINGINATRAFRGTIAPGGLIIRNVHVRRVGGDCLGVPNDAQFFAVEDSLVEQCGHHAFITSHKSSHLYVRVLRSHFRYADSHLVYIDRVARSDVIGNRCEAPGWGHCLRTMARVYTMDDNEVSNVHLDGTVPPRGVNPIKPNKAYTGMHPIDVYSCADGTVRGNRLTYYRERNVPVPINIRYRHSYRGCDVGEHDGTAWTVLDPTTPEFFDPARWQRIRDAGPAGLLTISVLDNVIRIIGPNRAEHHAVGVQGSAYPVMHSTDRDSLRRWLQKWQPAANQSRSIDDLWTEMRTALPQPHWRQIADLVLPNERSKFLRGNTTDIMPLAVPVGVWFQRQAVRIGRQTVTICDDVKACRSSTRPVLRPDAIRFIYFGESDPDTQFSGPTYRRAIVGEM